MTNDKRIVFENGIVQSMIINGWDINGLKSYIQLMMDLSIGLSSLRIMIQNSAELDDIKSYINDQKKNRLEYKEYFINILKRRPVRVNKYYHRWHRSNSNVLRLYHHHCSWEHNKIVNAVIAMAPLELPGYVLMWILEWSTPVWLEYLSEPYRIKLIQNIITSRRRIVVVIKMSILMFDALH